MVRFSEAIAEATGTEIGVDMTELPPDIELEVKGYVDDYAKRHIGSSEGQINALAVAPTGDPDELIVERMDEWHESRSVKIASNETVRASSMVAASVFFNAGLYATWRIRGASTCPYCRTLNGKKVSIGQAFAANDSEVSPEGEEPMLIRGLKKHPPLHAGCDCFLTAG